MDSKTYWEQRSVDSIGRMESAVNGQVPDLVNAFEAAKRDLNDQVERFFVRYAKNNKISLADAEKQLSLSELKDFRGDLAEYEKLAKNSIGTFNLTVDNLSVKARITRLEALQTQCEAILQKLYQERRDQISGTATEIYTTEYYHRLFDIEKYTGFKFNYSAPGSDAIQKVLQQPVEGMDISEHLWRQDIDTGFKIRSTLNNMFATGQPPQYFADQLQKQIGAVRVDKAGNVTGTGKKFEAYRLLYTESAHVTNQAQLQACEDDGIDEFEDIVSLDSRTCPDCAYFDGKHYPVNKAIEGVNHPPWHPFCRCTTAPYIPELANLSSDRMSRDPVTDDSMPTTAQTYDEWKTQQDEKYGVGTVDVERKKTQNEASDFQQYQGMKSILKEKSPQTFANFQNMKYNNPVEFESTKRTAADRKIQNRLASDAQPKTIDSGKQGKHIQGHNNYIPGRSYLTITEKEAQQLVDRYAGTGTIQRDRSGKFANRELVVADKNIGVSIDPRTGRETATNRFYIHYSKTGVHIVPTMKGTDEK